VKKCSLLIHKGDSKANKATKGRGRKKKYEEREPQKFAFWASSTEILLTLSQKCEKKRYCTSSNEFFKTLV